MIEEQLTERDVVDIVESAAAYQIEHGAFPFDRTDPDTFIWWGRPGGRPPSFEVRPDGSIMRHYDDGSTRWLRATPAEGHLIDAELQRRGALSVWPFGIDPDWPPTRGVRGAGRS